MTISAVFGFDDLPATELTCTEYVELWDALNGAPRRSPDPGRLAVFSSFTDVDVEHTTSWGFRDQDEPALAEWVQTGEGCRHWLFAAPRATEEGK